MHLGQAHREDRVGQDDPQQRLVAWRARAQVAQLHEAAGNGDVLLHGLQVAAMRQWVRWGGDGGQPSPFTPVTTGPQAAC